MKFYHLKHVPCFMLDPHFIALEPIEEAII